MKNLLNRLQFLIILLILGTCQNKNTQSVDLALMNAHAIDLVTGDITVKNIYISDGKIKLLEDVGTVRAYKADSLIDATGKYRTDPKHLCGA